METIKARHISEGTVFVTRAGHRRTVVAIDETRTHVYADFADGGSGIWELDADVTVDRDATATPSPVPASAAIGVMPNAATLADGHAHTAAYTGPCMGECGV